MQEVAKLNKACAGELLKINENPDCISQLEENAALFQQCAEVLDVLKDQQAQGTELTKKQIDEQLKKLKNIRE
jgi:hypothetical protein